MGWKFSILTWLLAPLGLIPALPPVTSTGRIHDDGKFFSAEATAQAELIIRRIHDDHHRDVLIESVAALTPEQRADLQAKGKDRFWQELTDARAKASGISGVYILICKDPAHLQVAVGDQTAQRLFTMADRDELARRMINQFKQKQFDSGLIDAAEFILRRMNAHSSPAGGQTPASSWVGPKTSVRPICGELS